MTFMEYRRGSVKALLENMSSAGRAQEGFSGAGCAMVHRRI